MLIDSTIFIEFFRNNGKAHGYLLKQRGEIATSRVVIMEIVAGLRSKEKIEVMKRQLTNLGVVVQEISEEISKNAGELYEKYHATEGMGQMDAFIAATAMKNGRKLVTHNLKHFKFIKGLELIVPY